MVSREWRDPHTPKTRPKVWRCEAWVGRQSAWAQLAQPFILFPDHHAAAHLSRMLASAISDFAKSDGLRSINNLIAWPM